MVPVRPRRTVAGVELAWIPPGTFLMGAPPGVVIPYAKEKQHRVVLTSGFWLGIYPVTQGQWQEVMGNNYSFFSRNGDGQAKVQIVSDEDLAVFPVERVTWDGACEFCGKLSGASGERVCLPTEAQWEYACRAGTTSTYHFGTTLDDSQANCKRGLERPTMVGSYFPNAWGLYDMHGNVWEWCRDGYTENPEELGTHDPVADSPGFTHRMRRGGAWYDDAKDCRASGRYYLPPSDRRHGVGLRIAVSCQEQ
jgi:formylglycine-generating enzyme required for sulfatase activity